MYNLSGWRKFKEWRKQIKKLMRKCAKIHKAKEKVSESVEELKKQVVSILEEIKYFDLEYFIEMVSKHINLIERRIIKGEKIPHEEKVFSLFEPHTEWVNKGKVYPSVELGHKLLITTDQYGLILDYKVMEQSVDRKESLPLVKRLVNRYGKGAIKNISFDKGFSSEEDRKELEEYIEEIIMSKRGKLNKAEHERESQKRFKELRNKHNAIESDINCLEHHGLNRCPDKGLNGFKRYAGLGVIAYNLHKIGNILLENNANLKKLLEFLLKLIGNIMDNDKINLSKKWKNDTCKS